MTKKKNKSQKEGGGNPDSAPVEVESPQVADNLNDDEPEDQQVELTSAKA